MPNAVPEEFTEAELNSLIYKLSNKAKADSEKVLNELEKDGVLFNTKWKNSQEKEVIALIEAGIKKVG